MYLTTSNILLYLSYSLWCLWQIYFFLIVEKCFFGLFLRRECVNGIVSVHEEFPKSGNFTKTITKPRQYTFINPKRSMPAFLPTWGFKSECYTVPIDNAHVICVYVEDVLCHIDSSRLLSSYFTWLLCEYIALFLWDFDLYNIAYSADVNLQPLFVNNG